jgi:hypothetical protein
VGLVLTGSLDRIKNQGRGFHNLPCIPSLVRRGPANRRWQFFLIWAVVILCASPAGAGDKALPKTFKGTDPKGWGPFQWRMTKAKAAQAGAVPFVDAAGDKRFGLPSVELLPGKIFRVRLEFFSHMGLNAVRVTLTPQSECAADVYETLLKDFRETHGKEMETRDLTYPNSIYQSHDWIVGTTKIVLHHGCPKPGHATASQPTTHIWYEKRMEFEPWNR